MSRNYHIEQAKPGTGVEPPGDRLARILKLLPHPERSAARDLGRNFLTRTVDTAFALLRKYLPPLHWIGVALIASILFLYARLVALTARLVTTGERPWPNVPSPCVLALWHRDAPSLLVAFAKRRPRGRSVIMIAQDSRGDFLALLCRLVGLGVVRGDSETGGWEALLQLADELMGGASVILTVDGGGPARIAKVGAVALASSVGVPLIPLTADCHPAIQEHHKWDAARNPLPFCSLLIAIGPSRKFDVFEDLPSVERARAWLEKTLNKL